DHLLIERAAATAVLDRPGDVEPPAGGEFLLPFPPQLPARRVGRAPCPEVLGVVADEMPGEPVAELGPEVLFLGSKREVHLESAYLSACSTTTPSGPAPTEE